MAIIKNPGVGGSGSGSVPDGSITGAANGAVDVNGSKIALNTIGDANIRQSAITSNTISAGAVTSAKIATSAITSAKLSTSAVTAAKISAGAVTSDKLGTSAVLSGALSTSAVTNAAISWASLGQCGAKTSSMNLNTTDKVVTSCKPGVAGTYAIIATLGGADGTNGGYVTATVKVNTTTAGTGIESITCGRGVATVVTTATLTSGDTVYLYGKVNAGVLNSTNRTAGVVAIRLR